MAGQVVWRTCSYHSSSVARLLHFSVSLTKRTVLLGTATEGGNAGNCSCYDSIEVVDSLCISLGKLFSTIRRYSVLLFPKFQSIIL